MSALRNTLEKSLRKFSKTSEQGLAKLFASFSRNSHKKDKPQTRSKPQYVLPKQAANNDEDKQAKNSNISQQEKSTKLTSKKNQEPRDHNNLRKIRHSITTIIFMLLGTVSISYLTIRANPGDLLYWGKLMVTDKIQVANSDLSQRSLQLQAVHQRIDEYIILAEQGACLQLNLAELALEPLLHDALKLGLEVEDPLIRSDYMRRLDKDLQRAVEVETGCARYLDLRIITELLQMLQLITLSQPEHENIAVLVEDYRDLQRQLVSLQEALRTENIATQAQLDTINALIISTKDILDNVAEKIENGSYDEDLVLDLAMLNVRQKAAFALFDGEEEYADTRDYLLALCRYGREISGDLCELDVLQGKWNSVSANPDELEKLNLERELLREYWQSLFAPQEFVAPSN